jgi:hypothetical protein
MMYALIKGEVWGVMPSIGLLMFAFALFGLLQVTRDRSRKD